MQAFFVISGFYMHLALSEKYGMARSFSGQAVRAFYLNRFLRLYPAYWFVLLVVIAFSQQSKWTVYLQPLNVLRQFAQDPTLASLSLVPNLFIIGSDVFRLFAVNPATGSYELFSQSLGDMPAFGEFLFIPQAWSVSNEIVFYALCPLLVRLRTFLLLLLIVLAYYLLQATSEAFAWPNILPSYNFYYFLLGMLSYRLKPIFEAGRIWLILPFAVTPFAICSFWQLFIGTIAAPQFSIWPLWAICMPALFLLTQKAEFDRHFGDLSYPVYLCHLPFLSPAIIHFGEFAAIPVFLCACAMAILVVRFVDHPIQRIKSSRSTRYTRAAGQTG